MSASQPGSLLENPRHPQQRFNSPSKGFSGAVHAIGIISFYKSFKFLIENPNIINESFGWHFQYLTIIGLSFSTLCFICGLLADILNAHTLFAAKNYLGLVAAPIEILISILYWGLRAIDKSLVVPPDLPLPPLAVDIGFHLSPAILLSIDALLLSPPWPTAPFPSHAPITTLILSTSIAFLYWFWIELCFTRNGFYPYPLFSILSTGQRIGLFCGSGVAMWGVGGFLRLLYRTVNGDASDGRTVGKGEKSQ